MAQRSGRSPPRSGASPRGSAGEPTVEEGETPLGALLPADQHSPEREIQVGLREQAVRDVVSALPAPQREVIRLRYGIDGEREPVSMREAARQLHVKSADVTAIAAVA